MRFLEALPRPSTDRLQFLLGESAPDLLISERSIFDGGEGLPVGQMLLDRKVEDAFENRQFGVDGRGRDGFANVPQGQLRQVGADSGMAALQAGRIVLGMLAMVLCLGVSVFLMGVPFRGSLAALFGLSTLFLGCALGFGLFLSTVMSWPGRAVNPSWPALAVLGACLCWAIDNNLTRKVSLADPLRIAAIKGVGAGLTNVTLAVAMGASHPSQANLAVAGIIGFIGYGISLVAFVVGLRELGTARTGAYFSTAPFVGAGVSVLLLGESITPRLISAAALMGAGVWLHLTERHEHDHHHQAMDHEHAHEHDEHHRHHAREPVGVHVHPHRHEPMTHRHPHFPDAHHRHDHV